MSILEPWDVADPERTLTEILASVKPTSGDVLVAMLRAAEHQELVDATRIHTGPPLDLDEARERLRRHARLMAADRPWEGPGWRVPEFLFITVVCRGGRVVPTASDYFWLTAWRYSNHLSNAFDGDVYLVTEHGWTGCIDTRAGFTPQLRESVSAPRQAVAPDA